MEKLGVKTFRYTVLRDADGYAFINNLKEVIEVGGAYVRVIEEGKILIAEYDQFFEYGEEIKKLSKKG